MIASQLFLIYLYLIFKGSADFLLPLTSQAVDAVGEILLSLSYLPTAERLTVVVAKCKNLVWTNGKSTAGQGLIHFPINVKGVHCCSMY